MKKENVVICSPCGERACPREFLSGVAFATKRGANKVLPILPLLPRFTVVFAPQGRGITTHGFTLIELLVVVLIIGILAAVAVPQYEIAVEKSKTAQGWTIVKALTKAQESYKLANGSYTRNWDDLDISMSMSTESVVNNCNIVPYFNSVPRQIGEWIVVLDRQHPAMNTPAMAVRNEGRFRCYALYLQEGKPYCAQSTDKTISAHQGNFCKKLGGTSYSSKTAWQVFPL